MVEDDIMGEVELYRGAGCFAWPGRLDHQSMEWIMERAARMSGLCCLAAVLQDQGAGLLRVGRQSSQNLPPAAVSQGTRHVGIVVECAQGDCMQSRCKVDVERRRRRINGSMGYPADRWIGGLAERGMQGGHELI